MANFREHSRDHNWNSKGTTEHINAGSFQRIADACEKMAGNYTALQNELKWANEYKDRYYKQLETEKKRTAALRGVINRMKKAKP